MQPTHQLLHNPSGNKIVNVQAVPASKREELLICQPLFNFTTSLETLQKHDRSWTYVSLHGKGYYSCYYPRNIECGLQFKKNEIEYWVHAQRNMHYLFEEEQLQHISLFKNICPVCCTTR